MTTTTPAAPLVGQFMTEHPCTVEPSLPLHEVVERLLAHGVSNAPVVEWRDGKQRLVGFLSERDCLAALADGVYFGTPCPPQTAATVMRRHPVCVAADTEMFAVVSIFVNHGFRHLPVVDGDTLLGIVSRRDVLRAMAAYERALQAASDRVHHPPDLHLLVNQRFVGRK